jgi:phosphatidylinositol glycan class F
MTSKTTTMAVAKPRHSTPTSQPITILQNDSARTYTHVHPFLVLGYYYFRFSALVLDPVSTLFRDLLPLAVLQAAYAVTCLPVTNESPAKPSTAAGKNAKAVSKKAKASVSIPNRIVVRSFHSIKYQIKADPTFRTRSWPSPSPDSRARRP